MADAMPSMDDMQAQWLSYACEISLTGDWEPLALDDAIALWDARLEAHDREVAAKALEDAAMNILGLAGGSFVADPFTLAWAKREARNVAKFLRDRIERSGG